MGWEGITRFPKVIVRENCRHECVKNVIFLLKIEREKTRTSIKNDNIRLPLAELE